MFGFSGNHPYIEAVGQISTQIVKRISNPLYLIDWIYYKSSDGQEFRKALDIVHNQTEEVTVV